MTTLYFKDGSSDKVYQVWIEPNAKLFDVKYAYGRRGSTLMVGIKNSEPIDMPSAEKLMEKMIREKMSKGYHEGEDGTPFFGTPKQNFTGIVPMLPNAIDNEELQRLLDHDWWVLQEKMDGRHLLIKKADNIVIGINRKGLEIVLPITIYDDAMSIDGDFILDGEAIGDDFHVFDIVPKFQRDNFAERDRELDEMMSKNKQLKHIVKVPTYYLENKRKKFNELKDSAEGVVMKATFGVYFPGRQNSGGSILKFKFYNTASVIVLAVNTKRSVQIFVDHEGAGLPIGNVTIPPNQDIPKVGDVIEVRYLYAYRNGALYQPVYLGVRDDIDKQECTTAQLHYKAEEE